MTALRFSVIIPTRNGGLLLRECIGSVLAQEHEEFELLVLDNASTDGSVDWIRDLDDPRVTVLRSAEPLSIEESWARITAVPKAKFMTIVGADDLLDPGFLEGMAACVKADPGAGLYQAGFRLIDATGKVLRQARPIPAREDRAAFLRARLRRERDSFGTGYVMRSADYDAIGGIPSFPGLLFADDALWLSILRNRVKIATPEILFSYRLHSGSASGGPQGTVLLTALSRYVHFLEAMATEEPALAGVISDDLPAFVRREIESWYLGQLMAASRQGRRGMSPRSAATTLRDIDPRLEDELKALRRTEMVVRAHEAVNAIPPVRALYARRKLLIQSDEPGR